MIFDEQISRKPDNYPWTQGFIDAMWQGHWTPNEFNFQSDIQDFKTDLTEQERTIITRALSAIGQIEIAVKRFWSRLGDNLPQPSLVDLGLVMAGVEVIHNKAYEKLLDTLQMQDVFEENLKLDIIKGRVQYLRKYLSRAYENDRKQYVYALILFTLFVENVSLFSQFYIILWFRRNRNVLKDTAQQVDYTKNEETLHAQAGIKIVQTIREEHPELFDADLEARIQSESISAFEAESKIIDWMIGMYESDGLNANVLKEYVKHRINDSLIQIGFAAPFTLDNALLAQTDWMDEKVLGNSATDFFHQRPVEYSKGHASFDEDSLFGAPALA
jgi:ribonucleoside-diphosphate reductase beta chain